MDFNYSLKPRSNHLGEQNPSTYVNQTRIQALVHGASKELVNKLCQLDQLRNQFIQEELQLRDQLLASCQEMRNDLETMESRQRTIEDCLKKFGGR